MSNPSGKAVWGAVLALALIGPTSAVAWSGRFGRLDRALQRDKVLQRVSSSGEERDVIIRVKPGRKSAVKNKVSWHTSHFHVHSSIEAISARLTAREIKKFANDPDVEGISIDADVNAL